MSISEGIEQLKALLGKPGSRAVIIPHISVDGDAAGSCSAFSGALEKAGVKCRILTCDYIPDYLRWLPRLSQAISFQDKAGYCKRLLREADMICMLDHNTMKREGDLEPWVRESKAVKVVIDHHPDPEAVDVVISNIRVSSTCELLYSVITEIWGREFLTPDMANALYTGINTDTGGLSHNSSHPETYRVIAELLESGLDKETVHRYIYETNKLSRLRLIGNILLNKLTVHPDYPVAVLPVTLGELESYNYQEGDLEGVVNIPLSVANIYVSVQVTQRKERIKLSFRSKGAIPVNEWARVHFNGGGHLNAAGGQCEGVTLEEVVQRVFDTTPWFFSTYVSV
ncbi:MAG: DHH family phosphoesterase [Culturomica sp.]|jgi:phosphoesterase RecJ-like protein|nr:DHH family phosphoesterase [Culturomica sp.]